jgi:hypothetical protein
MQVQAFFSSLLVCPSGGLSGALGISRGTAGPQLRELAKAGRICVAPLTRDVLISGTCQPGDEDTTRTYELVAAHCFFIHTYEFMPDSL